MVETVVSKLHQTILNRQATVLLDDKAPKHFPAVHLQLYRLALEWLATASAVFGSYDCTQSATPIPVTELIRQNIWFSNTKCILVTQGHSY